MQDHIQLFGSEGNQPLIQWKSTCKNASQNDKAETDKSTKKLYHSGGG